VARTQIKRKARINVLTTHTKSSKNNGAKKDKKITAENKHIIKILAYSAIKIKAKLPLLYSILNPETSSDSPSAKSNGVRLVSASVVMNQMNVMGKSRTKRGSCWLTNIIEKLKERSRQSADKRIKAILTS